MTELGSEADAKQTIAGNRMMTDRMSYHGRNCGGRSRQRIAKTRTINNQDGRCKLKFLWNLWIINPAPNEYNTRGIPTKKSFQ